MSRIQMKQNINIVLQSRKKKEINKNKTNKQKNKQNKIKQKKKNKTKKTKTKQNKPVSKTIRIQRLSLNI